MISADPGSFRDPASRIHIHDGTVVRALTPRGVAAWTALKSAPFYSREVSSGNIIESTESDQIPEGFAGAIEHPRLPLITYPFEWTFTMLKDAALLQLELLERALRDGLTIKDATPYNIQFVAGRPVFIDVGSFERYRPGEPWIGYRQFTRQFLFPLMLRAWAGVPFQPWLRGDPEGPTAAYMKSVLPLRKRLTPAALMHVSLQARMEERMSGEAVRQDLREAGFSAAMILANVAKLKKLVASLDWSPGHTDWTEYGSCTHVGRDRDAKGDFLRQALARSNPTRVLDLGANDGFFSEIAAGSGAHAIAVDGDEGILESVYRSSKGKDISVVVTDLGNPSPSQGWAGIERPSLAERAHPDLVLAYGLIHHLIYTASIPPASVLDWLAGFESDVVLEFVAPTDEMVGVLTANKQQTELHAGRSEEEFRNLLDERFEIASERKLEGGTRILFDLSPAS